MCAVCGSTCSITIGGGSAFEGHRFNITGNSPSSDVRIFGSGEYGAWLSCTRDGQVTMDCYDNPAISPGSTGTLAMIIDGTTYTATDAILETKSVAVDAKGIVEWSTTWRIVDDITNF